VADALTLAELPESPTAAGLEGSPGPGCAAPGSAEKTGGEAAAGAEGGAEAEAEGEEGEAAREPLAWLPATLASLALRLQALDASLLYTSGQPAAREQLEVRESDDNPHCKAVAPRCCRCCRLLACCPALPRHSATLTGALLSCAICPPQGYQFIQRPTAGRVVCGQPLGEAPTPLLQPPCIWLSGGGAVHSCPAPFCVHLAGSPSPLLCPLPAAGLAGRIKQTLFPPLPERLLYGPRSDFTFPTAQFQADVATGSDALVASTAGRGGRGRGRGRGRGGR
jgi:hypothetical protein